jgi:hypothetical protein
MKTRHVPITASAEFRCEEGDGVRVYIARIPGAGETRIEVAWPAVAAFEECVVGRVLGQPVPERLNCRRCGFDYPARVVGDDVLCWACKAPVSDGPALPEMHCTRCGKRTSELDAGGGDSWYCKRGCDIDPCDPAGGDL